MPSETKGGLLRPICPVRDVVTACFNHGAETTIGVILLALVSAMAPLDEAAIRGPDFKASLVNQQCRVVPAQPFEAIADPGLFVDEGQLIRWGRSVIFSGQRTEGALGVGKMFTFLRLLTPREDRSPPALGFELREGHAPLTWVDRLGRLRLLWAETDSLSDAHWAIARRFALAVNNGDQAGARILWDSTSEVRALRPERVYEAILESGGWSEPRLIVEPSARRIHWTSAQRSLLHQSDGAGAVLAFSTLGDGIWIGRLGADSGTWDFSNLPSTRIVGGGYPNLASTADGIVLAYIGPDPASLSDRNSVLVVRSPDSGATWNEPIVVQRSGTVGAYGMSLLSMDGTLHLVWGRASGQYSVGATSLVHATSIDGGMNWSTPHGIPAGGSGMPGRFYDFTLLDLADGRIALIYRKSGDPNRAYVNVWSGSNWHDAALLLEQPGNVADIAALAGVDGTVHVVGLITRSANDESELVYGIVRFACGGAQRR